MTEGRLSRELGVFGATMLGLGSILGTGIFVSIGIAAGAAGPAVILAIALAAGLATCNALSSAQLAAAHPISGGTYEYGYRLLHPAFGFTAGWNSPGSPHSFYRFVPVIYLKGKRDPGIGL